MIRDRFDDLGWYHFEWLVQSLLKAELGSGVESWGGHNDFGRDAYFEGPLEFPAKSLKTQGPFLFQVKFIENANAAGARPETALLTAVREEARRIRERRKSKNWKSIKHYSLWTNAPLSPKVRISVKSAIGKVVPRTQVHVFGGTDISNLLEGHAELRRAFPQLLSLRDLKDLIHEAVSKESIERSRSVIVLSRDLARVFVPTSAYIKAWETLRAHHFAVLEGPPEMGKTAIAWMIALAQLSLGWQMVACDSPDDFFARYESRSQQVFVADDAFGHTEYDGSRAMKWEGQLSRVYRQLDRRHWLLWTSRKHILERARRQIDLQGDVSKFPNPGAVLVDASDLSGEEKALMLYRHGRSGNLDKRSKEVLRANAKVIVKHSGLTPDRIRILVKETLPDIASHTSDIQIDWKKSLDLITETINNPTERTRKAFKALPSSHKWALIALLEAGYWPVAREIEDLYEKHCPSDDRETFDEVFDQLKESFVKIVHVGDSFTWVDWCHPSYRDLVIDELANTPKLRHHFLESMSLPGIKLAISGSGGPKGDRRFPLVVDAAGWESFRKRCLAVAEKGSLEDTADLLNTLRTAAKEAPDVSSKAGVVESMELVIEESRNRWDLSRSILTVEALREYCEASLLLPSMPALPKLLDSWENIQSELESALDEADSGERFEATELRSWSRFMMLVQENEPRLLRKLSFPQEYDHMLARLFEVVEADIEVDPIMDSAEALREEAARYATMSEALSSIAEMDGIEADKWNSLADRFAQKSAEVNQRAFELEAAEPEVDSTPEKHSHELFDIDALFSDL